jgi:glycosyltransferase involved in cell wall biosynthesis
MKALFLCPNLDGGGAERHWSILLPGLSGLGIGVGVVTLDGRGPFYSVLERAGIPAISFADHGRRGSVAAVRSLRAADADLIITRGTSAEGLGMLATRGRPTKWVVNWHHPDGLPLAPRRVLILRRILPLADAVVAVSDSQVPELLRYGVRREAIQVIHNGTDFANARVNRSETRRELGLADTEVAVLLAGRLEEQKRVDLFIESLALAQRENGSIVGLIAGSGPLDSDLRRQAERAAVNVRFLGRREDMQEIIGAVDALALTSDQEALPYVVLEAMAGSRPIVTTSVGALPEIVTPDVGLTVPPGDVTAFAAALGKLAGDSGLRSALGAAAQDRQTHKFSAEAMCKAYADAISRVVNGADENSLESDTFETAPRDS